MERSSWKDRAAIEYRYSSVFPAAFLGIGFFQTFRTAFSMEYSLSGAFAGGFRSGLVGVWNGIADAFGKSSFTLIARYKGAGDKTGTFLTAMLIFMLILSYLTVRSKNRWLLLIYALPALVLSVLFGLYPSPGGAVLLAGGILMSAAAMRIGERFQWESFLLIGIPVILLAAFAGSGPADHLLGAPQAIRHLSTGAHEAVSDIVYGTNPLGDGDLSTDRRKEAGDETALTVTASDPEPLYLRGYSGERYTGNRWEALSCESHYRMRDLTDALVSAGFSGRSQLSKAASLAGVRIEAEPVTIEIGKASGRYGYFPYEYMSGSLRGMKNWNSSFVTGSGFSRIRKYSFGSAGNLTGKWTDLAGKLYSADETADFQKYVRLESHYNTQVYDQYTSLDDDTIRRLTAEIGSRGNQKKGHIDYKTAIGRVFRYFDQKIIYTDKPEETGDPLESLFRYHKGSDVYCASAATLMFRYYGIPARYVEGYRITRSDAEKMMAGEPYRLKLSSEHAWTEIYVDGLGWVPVEVLQKYRKEMPEADLSRGAETDSGTNPFSQPESGGSGSVQTEKNNDSSFPWRRAAGILLIILMAAAAVYAAVRISGRVRKRLRWNRAFRQPDAKKALLAMYDYSVREEIGLPDDLSQIGLAAAYSRQNFGEEERTQFLDYLKNEKKSRKKRKKNT